MIKEIRIENYKSIETLSLSLGRVNVFIGENGCGKSNILEAIALYSASINNRLGNEFLFSRGIRVSQNPKFMRAAFKKENIDKEIKIAVSDGDSEEECNLQNDNKSPYSEWVDLSWEQRKLLVKKTLFSINKDLSSHILGENLIDSQPSTLINQTVDTMIKEMDEVLLPELRKLFVAKNLNLQDFLIYSPENTSLRTFEKEGQILPLGVKGEGLFKLLKVMSVENKERVEEIKECLKLIDWFKNFYLPSNLSENEKYIQIEDRYIDSDLKYFDQISSNEGFLFLLFYFCLFISSQTPKFFAVDNIDASLNPKLCSELIKRLVDLAKKYDKQAIFTTHNPAILDGLNLDDKEQKLFVIYRNKMGYTKVLPILKPKTLEGREPVRLSEAFLRGYIGGLPKNF